MSGSNGHVLRNFGRFVITGLRAEPRLILALTKYKILNTDQSKPQAQHALGTAGTCGCPRAFGLEKTSAWGQNNFITLGFGLEAFQSCHAMRSTELGTDFARSGAGYPFALLCFVGGVPRDWSHQVSHRKGSSVAVQEFFEHQGVLAECPAWQRTARTTIMLARSVVF